MHGTLPISEEFALAALRERRADHVNVAALAREWGWSRDKVRQQLDGWRTKGELPPAPKRRTTRRKETAAPPAPPAPLPAPATVTTIATVAPPPAGAGRLRRIGRLLGAASLAGVGVVLAAVGMVETTVFAMRVGGLLFAALAICADALVLLMPAAVSVLWRRRSAGAIAAAALWLVGCAVSLANLSGYIGSSDDGFTAARAAQALQRSLALEDLARLRRERASIVEMRSVEALEVELRNAKRWHQPPLREALAIAQRRDALDAGLATFAAKLPTIPQVATVDPSANVLSEITGANVSEVDLRRLRLLLLLVLPLCGGFAFSLALSLVRAPQRRA